MNKNFNIRIRLKSFDYFILNKLCFKLLNLSKKFNIFHIGPIFLPTKKKIFNILRSPHVNKDSRDQLQISIFKRFIDFISIDKTFLFLIKDIFLYYNLDFNFYFI